MWAITSVGIQYEFVFLKNLISVKKTWAVCYIQSPVVQNSNSNTINTVKNPHDKLVENLKSFLRFVEYIAASYPNKVSNSDKMYKEGAD